MNQKTNQIKAVLFDYGGVLADEGFRNGLAAIARRQGLDPEQLVAQALEAVYDSGYVLGRGTEAEFWQALEARSGLAGDFSEFRQELMSGFRLRPWMIEWVDRLKQAGYRVGILSDQTDWLDQLDRRDHFQGHFDVVFNSYHLGMGKRDVAIFPEVARRLNLTPEQILFIDDSPGHIERAR
ncbi:MAG TPA: HAD family phosphatase, partial [Candidatus Tenderia electrophaga]|nr:HAD family phosphatase [Candidatus Tenderia electrophaga]